MKAFGFLLLFLFCLPGCTAWEVLGWTAGIIVALIVGYALLLILGNLFLNLLARIFGGGDSRQKDTHGSARMGTPRDAEEGGHLNPKGVAVGRLRVTGKKKKSKKGDPPSPRYWVRDKHILTCAPTGAGKGIGCLIPNLLEYPGSVFVLDVKGEACAVTARRRREMGQEVHVLDPFGVTNQNKTSVNWLDWIDPESEESVSESASLADTFVIRSEKGESYWDDSAATLLQGLLLHVSGLPEEDRHMGTLRYLLTLPPENLKIQLEQMSASQNQGWGLPARAANTFLAKADRERSGVLSVAQQHTAFLDDPRITKTLKESKLDFRQLKFKPQTVYLVIPPDKLKSYNRYVRAVLSLAFKGLIQTPGKPEFPVLFMIDELAQLGHFAPIEDGISILRGYGGLMWLFVQDLSQLRGTYPKWETFIANTILQAFGTQDQRTAQYLSEIIGSTTVVYETDGSSKSSGSSTAGDFFGSSSSSRGSSTQTHHHGRAVMTADEIRRLAPTGVFVIQQGRYPQLLRRLDYRTDEEYQGQFDLNPIY